MVQGDSDFIDAPVRPWTVPSGGRGAFEAEGYYLGQGSLSPLEVAVARAASRPNEGDVRNLWKRRKGNQPSPLLLVVRWQSEQGERVSACGPTGDEPPVYADREPDQIRRIAELALAEPDHHAAIRLLNDYLPPGSGGVRNVALFATHHLIQRVPRRPDWSKLCAEGSQLLGLRREQLLQALGYSFEPRGQATLLRVEGQARGLALFLDDSQAPDGTSAVFNGMTPVSWALASAAADNIPYVVVARGPQLRLYTTGAAARGGKSTSNFVELNLPLLTSDDAGYLPLLFSAPSLLAGGALERLLAESQDFAADLGAKLRERVYGEAVPAIASALIAHHAVDRADTSREDLRRLYGQALLILFRLLFIAYAEDRDLLPLTTNGLYRQRSLKTIARVLSELAATHGRTTVPFSTVDTDYWDSVTALWSAVDHGRKEWNVPAYNGGMFSADASVNSDGAALSKLRLTNAEFGPALLGLLVDESDRGQPGPVDFASLDVREFGTIYEGLLESEMGVAPVDLATGKDDQYVPAGPRSQVVVHAGDVYLHNQSGARKASGSYFTKPFAVEHLLDHALEPALDAHLARLQALVDEGDEVGTAQAFFDFRCVDLAMGSGHFLVAAVDRIEQRFSQFLAEHDVPAVHRELRRLSDAAIENLAAVGVATHGSDTSALLRRQIARRCIYGVDLNGTAVELARLALWLHTFVRGLPLTSLDHGLVAGDSLTGVALLDDVVQALGPNQTFLRAVLKDTLCEANGPLAKFASTSEATLAEVKEARSAYQDAVAVVAPLRAVFDLAMAVRIGEIEPPDRATLALEDLLRYAGRTLAVKNHKAGTAEPIHFPIAFPEVFASDDAGFDCILGNPPWDKVMFEAQQFWVTREPGLNALAEHRREARIEELRLERPIDAEIEDQERETREQLQRLFEATYEKLGAGHYDSAKLFCERALKLLKREGALGYVLPRSCLVLGGWASLRGALFADGTTATTLQARNTGGWLFDDVHFSTMVALLSRIPGEDRLAVRIWPGITSLRDLERISDEDSVTLSREELRALTDTAVVPWFNTKRDAGPFDVMRVRPSLASGEGWVQGVHDARWDFRGSGPHRAYSSSVPGPAAWNILMTRHVRAYELATHIAFRRFVSDPASLVAFGWGVELDTDGARLGDQHPLLIMRHPSRNDDSRTIVATALPERGFLHNKGYVHAVRHEPGTSPQQLLALLAFLNSHIADWWVRRFVDRHVTAPVVNNLRLPDWDTGTVQLMAAAASSLLARGGLRTTAGGHDIEDALRDRSDFDLHVLVDVVVAQGFGLSRDQLRLMAEDFSTTEAAWAPLMRDAVLDELGD